MPYGEAHKRATYKYRTTHAESYKPNAVKYQSKYIKKVALYKNEVKRLLKIELF